MILAKLWKRGEPEGRAVRRDGRHPKGPAITAQRVGAGVTGAQAVAAAAAAVAPAVPAVPLINGKKQLAARPRNSSQIQRHLEPPSFPPKGANGPRIFPLEADIPIEPDGASPCCDCGRNKYLKNCVTCKRRFCYLCPEHPARCALAHARHCQCGGRRIGWCTICWSPLCSRCSFKHPDGCKVQLVPIWIGGEERQRLIDSKVILPEQDGLRRQPRP